VSHPCSTRGPEPSRLLWPWALLALAMAWVALVRVPLILNAEAHLDSDLAVDGLTLLDATRGHWRWHYPGTPHIGIGPVLLSWPQAMIRGADPVTLVSGGLIAYEALVLAAFLLAWRAFGPGVAAWGLVPLAFASTGTVWLSGRLTGGHLLTASWHAGAFALLYDALARGGVRRAAVLGLWCGLGLYLDAMFAFTLVALVPAAVGGGWSAPGRHRWALAFILAGLVGVLPREIGRRVDPHDAYREQFDPILDRAVLAGHGRLLVRDCLPRLIVGHRLPGLQSEPSPAALGRRRIFRTAEGADPVAWAATVLGLALFAVALAALVRDPTAPADRARAAVRRGLLGSTAAVIVGFVVNRNIYNSDNYRYLVFLLVPWSVGFGLALRRLWHRGRLGAATAAGLALGLAALMTVETARWYERFGWIDAAWHPVRATRADPALAWLRERPEVTHVLGDYWDVYRLAFLTGGRVRGVPYPIYPNRFPGWSRSLGPGRGRMAVLRPGPEWRAFLSAAWRQDGRTPAELRGVTIVTWPSGVAQDIGKVAED
jgi:hypothetical protein